MAFKLQNYNEFRTWVRWHDYVAIVVNEFPVLLIRRYDWLDDTQSTTIAQIFGFTVYQKIKTW